MYNDMIIEWEKRKQVRPKFKKVILKDFCSLRKQYVLGYEQTLAKVRNPWYQVVAIKLSCSSNIWFDIC